MITATKAHTPGPWKVITRANQTGVKAAIVVSPTDGNRKIVVFEAIYELHPQVIANARLIAAAPEMLALIKESLEPVGVERRQGLRDAMRELIIRVEAQ